MRERTKPILGALVTSIVIAYLGVTYFFGPIMADDAPTGAMMPAWASLLVYNVVGVIFYDWVNQQMNAPIKSAMVVAISQIMLVDVYYVLNGNRGIAAAGASAVVLLVAWGAVGAVYGKLLGGGGATEAAI
mgnify:FL=1|jgi:hypothetical protein